MIRENRGKKFAKEVSEYAKNAKVNGIDYYLHLNGQPSEPLIEHVSGQYFQLLQDMGNFSLILSNFIFISKYLLKFSYMIT